MVRLLRGKGRSREDEMREAFARAKKGAILIEVKDGQGRVVHRHEAGDKAFMERMKRERREGRFPPDPFIREMVERMKAQVPEGLGESWSFLSSTVIESGSIGRGTLGVGPWPGMDISRRADVRVVTRPGGRSKPMRLRSSPDLGPFEVEMDPADIEELGLSDGKESYLEVVAQDPGGEARGRGDERRARKVKVAAGRRLATDNETPPYTVESGFGFLKRRKHR